VQQTLSIIGAVKPLEKVDNSLISKCKTKLDAIRLMIQLSGMSNEHICDVVGIQPAQFTRIMQGRANVPADARYTRLLELCGNTAVIQWEAKQFGLDIVCAKEARIKELEQQLLEARA